MRFSIIIFCAVILLLVTGVLPVGKGLEATAVYTSPVMILLLGLLSGGCVFCCFKRRPIGFILVHIGVVIILGGALAGYIAGEKGMLQVPLLGDQSRRMLMTRDGASIDLGFDVTASDFEVEFYPPVYHLYRQLPPEEMAPGQMPFEKVEEYDTTGFQALEIEGVGRLEVSNLWNSAMGEWTPRRMIDSGTFLHRASQTPSHYGVTLKVADGEDLQELPVGINHPAGYRGWRFYLMSYDQMNRSYVVLSVRRDPGRGAVIAGIWIVMIGTFVFCFRRTGGAA